MERNEIWIAIKGYEGYYEVSTLGNVRSVDKYIERNNGQIYFRKGKILKPREG